MGGMDEKGKKNMTVTHWCQSSVSGKEKVSCCFRNTRPILPYPAYLKTRNLSQLPNAQICLFEVTLMIENIRSFRYKRMRVYKIDF
jgi:hypothetical protein